MKLGAAICAFGLGLSASGLAYSETPLSERYGVGSSLYWASVFEGSSADGFREKVLRVASDAELFRSGEEDDFLDESSFFALFSGILFRSCDQDMPTAEERDALAGLWPLTEGDEVSITSDGGATVIIGAPTQYFLMGAERAAHHVEIKYDTSTEEENFDEKLIVLDDLKLTVQIDWDDTSIDKVMLVTRAKEQEPLSPEALTLLDQCTPLFVETVQPE